MASPHPILLIPRRKPYEYMSISYAWHQACSHIWVAEDRSRDTKAAPVTRAPVLHFSPCRTRCTPQPWHSLFITQYPPLRLEGDGGPARPSDARGRKPTPRKNLPVIMYTYSCPASETRLGRHPFGTTPNSIASTSTSACILQTRSKSASES